VLYESAACPRHEASSSRATGTASQLRQRQGRRRSESVETTAGDGEDEEGRRSLSAPPLILGWCRCSSQQSSGGSLGPGSGDAERAAKSPRPGACGVAFPRLRGPAGRPFFADWSLRSTHYPILVTTPPPSWFTTKVSLFRKSSIYGGPLALKPAIA
jgi:hypothetical protein